MIPGVDVSFLQRVVSGLAEKRLHVYAPGERRSAVALVLRFADAQRQRTLSALFCDHRPPSRWGGEESRAGGSALMGVLRELGQHADPVAPSALRLLYVRRRDDEGGRWGGRVTLPGGHAEPTDADDEQTAQRAVEEQLGMPLAARSFVCLGRLPDCRTLGCSWLPLLGADESRNLVQARFVYLHVGDLTPSLRMATHEVDSVRWVPVSRLQPRNVVHGGVAQPARSVLRPRTADQRLVMAELFGEALLQFPSIDVTAADAAAAPPWRVWGRALRTTSELLSLADRPALGWPVVESDSALLQRLLIDPYHGWHICALRWYEASAAVRYSAWAAARRARRDSPAALHDYRQKFDDYHRGGAARRRRAILPPQAPALLYAVPEAADWGPVWCLGGVLAGGVLAVYASAALIYAVAAVLRAALGVERQGGAVEQTAARKSEYYAMNMPLSVENERRRRRASEHARARDSSASGSPSEATEVTATAAVPLAEYVESAPGPAADAASPPHLSPQTSSPTAGGVDTAVDGDGAVLALPLAARPRGAAPAAAAAEEEAEEDATQSALEDVLRRYRR